MKPRDPTRSVFVVDDDNSVRNALRLRLTSEGIGADYFADAEACLSRIERSGPPACLVCDVRLPGLSGLDLQALLNDSGRMTRLIVITGHGDIEMSVRALKAGAFDFIEKPFDPNRLIGAIRDALEAATRSEAYEQRHAELSARVGQLSDRQREVMDLAVQGLSNKEIAQRLRISPRTVESYRAWVMEKTGAANIAELVRIAMLLEK